jgi:hypothetical protein
VDLAGYRRGALNEALAGGGRVPGDAAGVGGAAEGAVGTGTAAGAGAGDAAQAQQRLAAAGIAARVTSAGARGDVSVLWPDGGPYAALLGEGRAALLAACRAAGFRYVTLALY